VGQWECAMEGMELGALQPMNSQCRFCGNSRLHVFLDLRSTPLANAYRNEEDLDKPETFYPLKVRFCEDCCLAQLDAVEKPEAIFSDYAYMSAYSTTWLAHCEAYANSMVERLDLTPENRVIEIASNDGSLLGYFKEKGIQVQGVDPAANVAAVAERNGIPTRVAFWGEQTAKELADQGLKGDLLVLNNVLAHVPNINDFTAGLRIALGPQGVITAEFPHLYRLVEGMQFDTVYHEHYSYLSFVFVCRLFEAHGLTVYDVEELPTHGGSLRIYGRHQEDAAKRVSPNVHRLLDMERQAGLDTLGYFQNFGENVAHLKRRILSFFIEARDGGKRVAGYGAPAKGNTLLNYCGIGTDMLSYTVDRNPTKQGKYLPGTGIPIYPPSHVESDRPDFLFVLPWNIQAEVMEQMSGIREWGGKFVRPIPTVDVLQ